MSIRPAYSSWPTYNQRLRETIAALTDEQVIPADDIGLEDRVDGSAFDA